MVNAMSRPLYPWECPDNSCRGSWVWTGADNLAPTGNHFMNSNDIATVKTCKMYLPSPYQKTPKKFKNKDVSFDEYISRKTAQSELHCHFPYKVYHPEKKMV
jgi:hypothetical protein